jgi:hypothetical protein
MPSTIGLGAWIYTVSLTLQLNRRKKKLIEIDTKKNNRKKKYCFFISTLFLEKGMNKTFFNFIRKSTRKRKNV